MFPRPPRVLRLALVVLSLSLSVLLLLKAAGPRRPQMLHTDTDVFLSRHLPSPPFTGLLSSIAGRPPSRPSTLHPEVNLQQRLGHSINTTAALITQHYGAAAKKAIVNPHHFQYVLNPRQACRAHDGTFVRLLVYVHAAPSNLKKRQSIRQTWGDRSLLRRFNATLVFIMGTVQDARLTQLVQLESERYGDIVQEDFVDSYRNLTYKAIAGLKWAATFCSKATYILKTDDDILVNLPRVVKHIHDVVEPQYGTRRLILCNQWLRMKIIREKKSKWYIPEQDFPGDYFPPYCSGSAFLLSGDMARLMFEASLVTQFFWVDDYYITGALIKELDVKHKRLNQAYSLNPNVAEGKFRNDTRRELFFFHLHKLRMLYGLWRNMTQNSDLSVFKSGIPLFSKSVQQTTPEM